MPTVLSPKGRSSAWHLFVVCLDDPAERKRVFDGMRAAGIQVNVHYIPIHTQPYYQALGFKAGDFPHAERYYAGALSLPLYYELTDEQQDHVIETLRALVTTPSSPRPPAG